MSDVRARRATCEHCDFCPSGPFPCPTCAAVLGRVSTFRVGADATWRPSNFDALRAFSGNLAELARRAAKLADVAAKASVRRGSVPSWAELQAYEFAMEERKHEAARLAKVRAGVQVISSPRASRFRMRGRMARR